MLNILFYNDKTLKFNINRPYISSNNEICENKLDIILDHLIIFEFLVIDFTHVKIVGQYMDTLFNILINRGDKLNQVRLVLGPYWSSQLNNFLVEYITTSKDCSKMVPDIRLKCLDKPNLKLSERAKEVKNSNDLKSTSYLITNIHNPKTKFYFNTSEPKDNSSNYTLRIIKE
ncbi:unnamed protein product [Meloidogyne enterolobii]|uniref:Uncharacterized protein n=1 Tax=Meloidogyne enterolobii TaxID=390850 RepID=A0ACB0YQ18_MELEN